ncbi:MAG: SBBP repeat-containing protein, partial [candidate division Zixibacteria bacterium]|nr:SBBP repeat-containing protein [candidate division Zixibacteria bacterium]
SSAPASGGDFTTIKYNSNGDTVWVRYYNGPGNSTDEAQAIQVDQKGRLYVTGKSLGSGTSDDFATIKYNSNGDTLWVRRYNGSGNGVDQPLVLNVDDSGFVYVSGYTWNGTSNDYTTIKYDSSGNTIWVRIYNGPGNGNDQALAQALDQIKNVYVTGFSIGSGTGEDYATIEYTKDGTIHGLRRFNGPANGNDRAMAIAVDNQFIYVTGRNKVGSSDDFTTIKYFKNLDPVLDSIGPQSVPEGSNLTFRVHAIDPNGTIPALTASDLPSLNASFFDSANGSGSFSFNPDYNQAGVYNVTFRASDGILEDTETVEITVSNTNRAPVLSADNGRSGIRNSSIILPVFSFDPDGGFPILSATNLPVNSSFIDSSNGKGVLFFTPSSSQVGVHSNITFVATDGFLADSGTTEIHVFIRQDTLTFMAFSPVNLVITDPKQDSIGLGFNTILENSDYDTTQDLNNDGKKDDVVTILTPYLGEYNIRAIPTDTGKFTLQYILNSNYPTILANLQQITDLDTSFSYSAKILETLRGDPNRDGKQNLLDI